MKNLGGEAKQYYPQCIKSILDELGNSEMLPSSRKQQDADAVFTHGQTHTFDIISYEFSHMGDDLMRRVRSIFIIIVFMLNRMVLGLTMKY